MLRNARYNIKRLVAHIGIIFTLCIFLFAGSGLLLGCNGGLSYSENNYEYVDNYKYIKSAILKKGKIQLHIEDCVFESRQAAEDILACITNDYQILNNALGKNSEINLFIIGDNDILGLEHSAYVNGNILCNLSTIENSKYRLHLVAAYLNITDPWKQIGAFDYFFQSNAADTVDLAKYYSDVDNMTALTLFAAYFNESFSDETEKRMAEQTAVSFSRFVIDNYGFDCFLKCGNLDYRQQWLSAIGSGQTFSIPYDLSWLEGATYSCKFFQYPLVITTHNRVYYLNKMQSQSEWANFENAFDIIYHLSIGYSELCSILEHIKKFAPNYYPRISSSFNEQIDYYISDTQLRTAAEVEKREVYLLDPSEYVHETVHIVTMDKNPFEGAWLGEGVAEYFSREISKMPSGRAERFYGSFTQDFSDSDIDLKNFVEEVLSYYSDKGGALTSLKEFDFALLEESIGHVTLSSPAYKTQIKFDFATKPVSIYPVGEGNELTYPEAYVFTKFLIETYGLDKVLSCCASYNFAETFDLSYADAFELLLV